MFSFQYFVIMKKNLVLTLGLLLLWQAASVTAVRGDAEKTSRRIRGHVRELKKKTDDTSTATSKDTERSSTTSSSSSSSSSSSKKIPKHKKSKSKSNKKGKYVDSSSEPRDRLDTSRIVQLVQWSPSALQEQQQYLCMGYDGSLTSPLQMWPCQGSSLDLWSLQDVVGHPFLYQLRHVASDLCLPENPEHPDRAFECFASSGPNTATADSINGLEDCSSPYVATLRSVANENDDNFVILNRKCEDRGNPTALMTLHRTAEVRVLLWGEEILIADDEIAAKNQIYGNWMIIDFDL